MNMFRLTRTFFSCILHILLSIMNRNLLELFVHRLFIFSEWDFDNFIKIVSVHLSQLLLFLSEYTYRGGRFNKSSRRKFAFNLNCSIVFSNLSPALVPSSERARHIIGVKIPYLSPTPEPKEKDEKNWMSTRASTSSYNPFDVEQLKNRTRKRSSFLSHTLSFKSILLLGITVSTYFYLLVPLEYIR